MIEQVPGSSPEEADAWEEKLLKGGNEFKVFDPANKGGDEAKEVPLDDFHPDEIPLDRAEAGEMADRQPETPVEAVQRADRVEQVRKTLESIIDKDAEVLVRRNTEDPSTGEVETYESIAKTLPRGDGTGKKGVSTARVQQRERSGKYNIGRQISSSDSAGHPLKDYRDGLDQQ